MVCALNLTASALNGAHRFRRHVQNVGWSSSSCSVFLGVALPRAGHGRYNWGDYQDDLQADVHPTDPHDPDFEGEENKVFPNVSELAWHNLARTAGEGGAQYSADEHRRGQGLPCYDLRSRMCTHDPCTTATCIAGEADTEPPLMLLPPPHCSPSTRKTCRSTMWSTRLSRRVCRIGLHTFATA